MVTDNLSETLIDEGAKLVAKLDELEVEVSMALWLRMPDIEAWKLTLLMPVVERRGPRHGYELIQRALTALQEDVQRLALSDVAVLKPESPVPVLLRVALRTGPGISRIWFRGNTINGHLFPDALVYRVT